MSAFANRTGLQPASEAPRRYLWTDAFAVCNFLELFKTSGDDIYRTAAVDLIGQVHRVLGRFRVDDARQGWISGLAEQDGARHPTAGGLRIGKPLPERAPDAPYDERLEWDRDGQYFHYLTKWMHALCQASAVLGEARYARWAEELGATTVEKFAARARSGALTGLFWKMSSDLSRPLVAATGAHDALDGFISLREARQATADAVAIESAIAALAPLCQRRHWSTDDPLGLGGLLFDVARLCQLQDANADKAADAALTSDILGGCLDGLAAYRAGGDLSRPLTHRLAFRELGLAIGLQALPTIAAAANAPALSRALDALAHYQRLSEQIVEAWLSPRAQADRSWQAHQDINEVMLATALMPATFLAVGKPASG